MFNRRRITAALIGLIVLVLGGWFVQNAVSDNAPAKTSSSSPVAGADSGLAVKPLSSLPAEAKDTWKLIKAGGPYPYPANDDVVFGNRERLLPLKQSGYYREYTVKTPGSPDRGARRLITGQSQELYYTGDHYSSFVVVDTVR
ncbi:MAG: ribonuclease [Actinomycetota bacterium]|jgi:guanyl-specific ribonuclease Sa|nr:ribonuclease [Actinomycetota bacterium]